MIIPSRNKALHVLIVKVCPVPRRRQIPCVLFSISMDALVVRHGTKDGFSLPPSGAEWSRLAMFRLFAILSDLNGELAPEIMKEYYLRLFGGLEVEDGVLREHEIFSVTRGTGATVDKLGGSCRNCSGSFSPEVPEEGPSAQPKFDDMPPNIFTKTHMLYP